MKLLLFNAIIISKEVEGVKILSLQNKKPFSLKLYKPTDDKIIYETC